MDIYTMVTLVSVARYLAISAIAVCVYFLAKDGLGGYGWALICLAFSIFFFGGRITIDKQDEQR